MVLRIEPLLILGVGSVFAMLLLQNPGNVHPIKSNTSKELTFTNFSLIEITPKGVENQLNALEAIKFKDYFELQDINITYKNTHHLLAQKATYRDDFIYLNDSVVLKRDDGFLFTTEQLEYSVKAKQLYNHEPFRLDMNESHIVGNALRYNFSDKNMTADGIRATIYFE